MSTKHPFGFCVYICVQLIVIGTKYTFIPKRKDGLFLVMPPTVFLQITRDTNVFDIRVNLGNLTPVLV